MEWRRFGETFVTLLVIMDPPGVVPVFLAVTAPMERAERRRAAVVATGTAFLVITLFALLGRQVLQYLHVSLAAMQGAGGLLLLMVSVQLLTGRHDNTHDDVSPEQRRSVGMVPLGTPILAGPGAIVATIVFVQQSHGAQQYLAIALSIVAVHVVIGLVLLYSGIIRRVIRDTGVLLVSRVAGLLLAAISVQLIADSVTAFVRAAR